MLKSQEVHSCIDNKPCQHTYWEMVIYVDSKMKENHYNNPTRNTIMPSNSVHLRKTASLLHAALTVYLLLPYCYQVA